MKSTRSKTRQTVVLVWRQLVAIARTTHVECMQQPAVMLLLMGGVIATAMIPLLQFHQFGEAGRLARDGALAYQLTLGLVLAVVAASQAIHGEIESGTASAAISKPLTREAFVIGKFAGVVSMLTQFWFILLAAMLIAERVTYRLSEIEGQTLGITDERAQAFLLLAVPVALAVAGLLHNLRRVRFCLAACRILLVILTAGLVAAFCFDRAGTWHPSPTNVDLRIVPASLLIFMALVLFAAIASALSTRLKAGGAMTCCLLLLLLGLAADTLLAPASPAWIRLPARLLPNIQSFWLCDALTAGGTVDTGYLLAAILYGCAGSAVAILLGLLAFRRRDIN